MNIEKTIKKQSLSLLSKDNWGNAMGGFLIAVLPTVLLMLLDEVIFDIINLFIKVNTANLFYQGVFSFISLILVIVWLFSTPIFTGYFRMCYLISKGQDYSLKDIFYYFNKEKYNKCLSLNLNIMVRILGYFMIFTVPALIFSVFFAITSSVALLAFSIVLTVMAVVATAFVCIKYTIVPCVYFEDESISNEEIIKLGLNFISDKINDCRKILLSFLPYILLCFFIVPLIFVVPYITVAFMNNGKWITSMYIQE